MKNFETKLNMTFAILFAAMALICLVGAAFCEAWWHLYTFLICAGMTRMFLTARDDSGDSAWFDAFGDIERSGVVFVWGNSGNGKSSFVMQFCKELTKFGRVIYDSLEEGVSYTM